MAAATATRRRFVIVANVVNLAIEVATALAALSTAALGARLAMLLALLATAGMCVVAIAEQTAKRPPRHRWTVLFALLAALAATLDWASGRRRTVDAVRLGAMLFTAAMNGLVRRRRARRT